MAQEILDGRKIGIGIQHLCGHPMTKMMAGYFQTGPPGIIFHTLLNAANGDRLSRTRSFFHQKDLVPEYSLQLFQFQGLGDAEHALVAIRAAVGDENVALGIESKEVAKYLDGNDGARNGILF